MKKLTFLKEYQQFREDFEFNDAPEENTDIVPAGGPEGSDLENIGDEEEEQTEASCQDILGDAVDNLQISIQNCMGGEAEETETQEEEEETYESLEEGEEEHEEEESHDSREMEIYGRMKEISDELQGLMSELRGEEASEGGEEAGEGTEDFGGAGLGEEGLEDEEEEEDEA
jgi:hypothetical protein